MSRVTPELRIAAELVIAAERHLREPVAANAQPGFRACEKLRRNLAVLMGNIGARTLLARALALASPQAPLLKALRVEPDGSLAGLEDPAARASPQDIAEGAQLLLLELLGLLVAFIGLKLTLRILVEVWPRLSLDDLEFEKRSIS